MNYLVIGSDPATSCGLAAQLFNEDGEPMRPLETRVVDMSTTGSDNFEEAIKKLIRCAKGCLDAESFTVVFGVESYGSWSRARASQSRSSAVYNLLCKKYGKQIGRGKDKVVTAYRPKPQEWQRALGWVRGMDTKIFAAYYCCTILHVDLTGDKADAACIMDWTKTEFFRNLKVRKNA